MKLGDDLNIFSDIVDLDDLTHILGIRSQPTEDGAPVSIPMNTDYPKLIDNDECVPNNGKYRRAVGVLLYLSTVSRPHIATGVGYSTGRDMIADELTKILPKDGFQEFRSSLDMVEE
ncbi:hypothetical protein JTB14_023722 [Gonioctena quinquepunctata]|nr:hypothetical protein JTB14_023722 [Gonioctena quinquepunctata]